MVGYRGSSAGSYLADPTSPILSHCASIVATSTVRVNDYIFMMFGVTLEYYDSRLNPLVHRIVMQLKHFQ